jgi:FtsH-binding integral membrane protein
MLSIFTVSHSYMIAGITSTYDPETILAAALCTLGMFIALTMYACFTKKDITKLGGALSTATMMIFCFIILSMMFRIPATRIIIVIVVIILMSVWVVYDTQLIIGNDKRYRLEVDDYCIGALIIYTDILTIFLYILELLGGK